MTRFDGPDGVRILVLVAVLAAVVLPVMGGSVAARPPPQAVCGVCGDSLVDAGAANDVDIDVSDSALAIRVDRSGTGHWTATVDLTGPGVQPLRENASLRNRIVHRVFDHGRVAVENPQALSSSVDGRTLIVEYEVPAMAHQSVGGLTVVDFFYWHGGDARWFYLAADSMTMEGPPGTVVSHAPADTTTTDRTVTWTGSDQQYDPLDVRTHVVFAPNTGVVSGVATAVGIGVDVAQLKIQDLSAAVAPLVLLVLVVASVLRFGTRLAALRRSRLIGLSIGPLVVAGLVAATAETLVGVTGPLTARIGDFLIYLIFVVAATGAGPALVFGGPIVVGQVVLLGRIASRHTTETDPDVGSAASRLLLWPAATVLAIQWLLLPVVAAGAAGYDATYGLVSLVLPVTYFVPLAVAQERGDGIHRAFAAGLVLASIPVVVALAPHTGMNLVRRPLSIRYVPWALVVGAIGTIGYALGRRRLSGD